MSPSLTTGFLGGTAACPADFAKPLTTIGRLSVAGKGTISITFAGGARCLPIQDSWDELWLSEAPEFTITGGTGAVCRGVREGTRERVDRSRRSGDRDLDGDTRGAGPKVRRDGAEAAQLRLEDPTSQRGAKSARVTFKVTATYRRARSRAGLVPAQVGQPLQDQADAGALHGHRLERQHRQGGICSHCEARAMTRRKDMTDVSTNRLHRGSSSRRRKSRARFWGRIPPDRSDIRTDSPRH